MAMDGHGPGRMTMWRCPAPLCACQRSGRTLSPSRWRRRSWNGQSLPAWHMLWWWWWWFIVLIMFSTHVFLGFHFLFLLQEPISPDDVRELLKSAPGGELWLGWWKHWGTKRTTFPQNMSEWRHDKAWLKLGNTLKPNKFLSKNGLVSKCGIPRGFKPHSHDETNLGYSPLARC